MPQTEYPLAKTNMKKHRMNRENIPTIFMNVAMPCMPLLQIHRTEYRTRMLGILPASMLFLQQRATAMGKAKAATNTFSWMQPSRFAKRPTPPPKGAPGGPRPPKREPGGRKGTKMVPKGTQKVPNGCPKDLHKKKGVNYEMRSIHIYTYKTSL